MYLFKKPKISMLMVMIMVVGLLLAGCSSQPTTPASAPTASSSSTSAITDLSQPNAEFSALQKAAEAFVAKPARLMTTKDVYEKIVQGKDSSYWILSTRSQKDYDAGHVEGAVLITRTDFAKEESFAKLPKDKKIVSYCYTGTGAAYVITMLNLMGYDATAMQYGMADWTSKPEVLATTSLPKAKVALPVETTENKVTGTHELPQLNTGKSTAEEIVKAMGKAYFGSAKALSIGAPDLKTRLVDMKDQTTYLVIDVRSPELYAKGHIPGAVNIPYSETMKMDNLKKIPSYKTLVIVSEDGQSANQVSALYNYLGYNSQVLLFGMMAWTNDANVIGMPLLQGPPNYPWVGTVKP